MQKRWMLIRELMNLGGYQLTRWFSKGHPRILMYHRVLPAKTGRADITPDMFRSQLALLDKHFNVQPLERLIEDHQKGRLSPHSVALTFDDGYADFNTGVVPELVARGFPATLFVTTDFIDGKMWMWPDILRWALDESQAKEWASPDGRRFRLEEQRVQAWHAAADHVMQLPSYEKMPFVTAFCRSLEVSAPAQPTPEFRPLTWQDLRQMPALVTIGSHTVSHPILSRLDAGQVAHELTFSKQRIEQELNREIAGFCYPYGMPGHVSAEVFDAVAKVGYRYGCVAYPGKQPLRDLRAINRYATSTDPDGFRKILYGVRYFRL